ncbi:MAG: DUF4358 domain-containing protein [Bacillota bacterium]|nr:DUF4358 domain-containing protein [Bacillota bacterium]
MESESGMRLRPLLCGLLAIMLVLPLLLGACGSGGTTVADVDLAALEQRLRAELEFKDEMMALDDSLFARFYDFDIALAADHRITVSSGWTPEEIALFKARDEAGATAIEKGLTARRERQIERFTDYVPEERPKAEGAVIIRSGLHVAYVACAKPEDARRIIKAVFGG